MYDEIIEYLKENTGLSFKDWQCVTALILPNSNTIPNKAKHQTYAPIPYKPSVPYAPSHHSHYVITSIDLIPNTILAKLNINKKFEIEREFEVLSAIAMTSIHSAATKNAHGIPELCQIPSEVQRTHREIAGATARPDGPGFDVDKLPADVQRYAGAGARPTYQSLKTGKEPANSYPSWLFWNPSQVGYFNKLQILIKFDLI